MFHSLYCLVAMVIYVQCQYSHICVYTHILCSMELLFDQKKFKKMGHLWMLHAKEIFLRAIGSQLWVVRCLSDTHSVWFVYKHVLWYYCTSYVVLHCFCQQTEELRGGKERKGHIGRGYKCSFLRASRRLLPPASCLAHSGAAQGESDLAKSYLE